MWRHLREISIFVRCLWVAKQQSGLRSFKSRFVYFFHSQIWKKTHFEFHSNELLAIWTLKSSSEMFILNCKTFHIFWLSYFMKIHFEDASTPVVLNRVAVRFCQGCHQSPLLLTFRPVLASRGAAKYWLRLRKGWETLLYTFEQLTCKAKLQDPVYICCEHMCFLQVKPRLL